MYKSFINKEVGEVLKKLKQHKTAYIFLEPISNIISLYPDYKEIIKNPIDLNIIQDRVNDKYYTSSQQFKQDVETMINNCKTYNITSLNYIKASESIQEFFINNFRRVEAKITKNLEKFEERDVKQKIIETQQRQNQLNSSNPGKYLSIISDNTEEEKIFNKLLNLFLKINNELAIEPDMIEETVNHITRSITRKTKSFEIIYDDTVKFLNTNMKNKEDKEVKSKFLKKFRKIIKSIKEEQGFEMNKLCTNLNTSNSQLKQNKDYLALWEQAKVIVQDYIDNQKIPEVYREIGEYSIE